MLRCSAAHTQIISLSVSLSRARAALSLSRALSLSLSVSVSVARARAHARSLSQVLRTSRLLQPFLIDATQELLSERKGEGGSGGREGAGQGGGGGGLKGALSGQCVHLLGLDVMFDSKLRCQLLEAGLNPRP